MKRTAYTESQLLNESYRPVGNHTGVSDTQDTKPLRSTTSEISSLRLSQIWDEERIKAELNQRANSTGQLSEKAAAQTVRYSID